MRNKRVITKRVSARTRIIIPAHKIIKVYKRIQNQFQK
jgi:hypothetical protein